MKYIIMIVIALAFVACTESSTETDNPQITDLYTSNGFIRKVETGQSLDTIGIVPKDANMISNVIEMTIFPNPVVNSFSVEFTLNYNNSIKIEVEKRRPTEQLLEKYDFDNDRFHFEPNSRYFLSESNYRPGSNSLNFDISENEFFAGTGIYRLYLHTPDGTIFEDIMYIEEGDIEYFKEKLYN